MIKRIAVLGLIMLLSLAAAGCMPQKGKFVLNSITTGSDDPGGPYFLGTVRNDGGKAVYNATIEFTIYQEAEKVHIIDTAWDYIIDGGTIGPGEIATFHATAFDLVSVGQLQYYSYRIDWLDRN